MGIMNFMKGVGAKILGRGDDSTAIKQHVTNALGTTVRDLDVAYKDGTVTLKGNAASQADKEKAMLLAGNVEGVEHVNSDELVVPAAQTVGAVIVEAQYYTIEKGDTLSAIAKKVYKDAGKYQKIFEANREVIRDPNLIYPGQKIRLPDLAAP